MREARHKRDLFGYPYEAADGASTGNARTAWGYVSAPLIECRCLGQCRQGGTLPQQTSTPAQQVKRTRPQATPSDGTENGHRARPRLLAGVSQSSAKSGTISWRVKKIAVAFRIYHGSVERRDGVESFRQSLMRLIDFFGLPAHTRSSFATCYVD